MDKNILIVGDSSYVGKHLIQFYSNQKVSVCGTSRHASNPAHFLDLETPDLDILNYHKNRFTHAIICAAVPNIVACEENPKKTYRINVLGTLNLIDMLVEKGIKPIVFSSDIVFDGTESPYYDESLPSPINEYGFHKAFLEYQVPRLTDDYLLIRLSKVYSTHSVDNTMLYQLAQRLLEPKKLKAASDLLFNPITIDDVVQMIDLLIQNNCKGLYNVSGPETTSWYHLTRLLAQAMGQSEEWIEKSSIDEFSKGAKRAKNLIVFPRRFSQEFPQFKFTTIHQSIEQLKEFYQSLQGVS